MLLAGQAILTARDRDRSSAASPASADTHDGHSATGRHRSGGGVRAVADWGGLAAGDGWTPRTRTCCWSAWPRLPQALGLPRRRQRPRPARRSI